MKTIVLISDSFKGTLSSADICNIAKEGITKHGGEFSLIALPVADGGEGTCEAFSSCMKGEWVKVDTVDANLKPITASYYIFDHTAIIEVASVVGLPSTSIKNPRKTATFGIGALMIDARNRGVKRIILGLGGSATNDAGIGLTRALGGRFLNKDGEELSVNCPEDIEQIDSVDFSAVKQALKGIETIAMCDVSNPLCGPNGASTIYGPQKGASKEDAVYLDSALAKYASLLSKSLGHDESNVPGAGAAGGLGFCVREVLDGSLRSGIDTMLDAIGFDAIISRADVVVTGEGRTDSQSFSGKVIDGVSKRTKSAGKPLVLIVGSMKDDVTEDFLKDRGISSIYITGNGRGNFDEAKIHAKEDYEAKFHLFLGTIK